MLNQARDGAIGKAQTSARLDTLPVPQDERNPSQEVALRHRRIGGGHGVSASQKFSILRLAPGYDAVSKKAAVAAEQDDVSGRNGVAAHALNYERVSRPDRGQHAPSGDAQAQSPGRAQHFPRQFTLEGVGFVPCWWRQSHDALVWPMQPDEVGSIFPHESAVVTNTCS